MCVSHSLLQYSSLSQCNVTIIIIMEVKLCNDKCRREMVDNFLPFLSKDFQGCKVGQDGYTSTWLSEGMLVNTFFLLVFFWLFFFMLKMNWFIWWKKLKLLWFCCCWLLLFLMLLFLLWSMGNYKDFWVVVLVGFVCTFLAWVNFLLKLEIVLVCLFVSLICLMGFIIPNLGHGKMNDLIYNNGHGGFSVEITKASKVISYQMIGLMFY